MRIFWYILFLIFCSVFTLNGQRLYKTSSGQKFMLNDDNSWYFVEGIADAADTLSGLPNESKYHTLLYKSFENEVNTYVLWLSKNNEIAVTEMTIKQTREASNNPVVIAKLNEKVASLKKEENAFLTQYSKNAQLTKRIQASQSLQGKKQEKEWNDLAKQLNIKFTDKSVKNQNEPVVSSVLEKPKEFIHFEDEKSDTEKPAADETSEITETDAEKANEVPKTSELVIIRKPDCPVQKISTNVETNIKVIEMEPGMLFTHTPEKLKSYFKAKDFLTATASLIRSDKKTNLSLKLTFFSKDAAKTYGYISNGSIVVIQLINGVVLRLKTVGDSQAGLEAYTGNTIYNVLISLDNDSVGLLEKVPMDNIGIMWSTGFENYTIFEVDLFMNQLKCLKKFK